MLSLTLFNDMFWIGLLIYFDIELLNRYKTIIKHSPHKTRPGLLNCDPGQLFSAYLFKAKRF